MRVLDLFSGIGGFSLGLERAGMSTVAFCEIEPYCRAVLAKHWPEVPIYEDIRTLTAERLAADGIAVDVICGGFPCQDISAAGLKVGITGSRSGLWREYARLIGELRPRYVIVENVAALLSRGLGDVLGDLAEIGFDAEWHCIPASAVGAPHRRDRLWIVANAPITRQPAQRLRTNGAGPCDEACICRDPMADPARIQPGRSEQRPERQRIGASGEPSVGNAEHGRFSGRHAQRIGPGSIVPSSWWIVEPDVGRVAHGVPQRVDRLKALGNAVVPQIPELIGRAIMNLETPAPALPPVAPAADLTRPRAGRRQAQQEGA